METCPSLPSRGTVTRPTGPDWMEVEAFQYHSSNFGPAPKSNRFFILWNTTDRRLRPQCHVPQGRGARQLTPRCKGRL